MKRFLTLILTLTLLCATGCTASNDTFYQQAQRFLGAGDYAGAARLFDQLGGYRDSTEYALYAAALYALQKGDTPLARASFLQVEPFLNSTRYLTYLDAADLAAADELEVAAALYESLGAFADSAERALQLQAEIPARDVRQARALMNAGGYQQAQELLMPHAGMEEADALLEQCAEGLLRQAYDQAQALYQEGQYADALSAFQALGDALDAEARALTCLSALYQQAEADFLTVDLDTCEELIQRYASLEGYLNSNERIAQLQERFSTNLLVRDTAHTRPYVRYSSYPLSESGAEGLLTWRVAGVVDNVATLLCESVIDAMPVASATDLCFGTAAVTALPDLEQLSALPDLTCTATPYALAQGVQHHSDGRAWWWLADTADEGRNVIVWYNGSVLNGGVAADEPTVGVRPVIYLNLNEYTLTQGSGTPDDPFR